VYFAVVANSAIVQYPTATATFFDSIRGPLDGYAKFYFPLFDTLRHYIDIPDVLLHWGHGAAMASVLLTMGIVGAIMGWQIRLGQGNIVNALSLGESIRQAHPKIIGGAYFFFLLGGQGGLVLKDYQCVGQVLDSPHGATAALSLLLLTIQALLPLSFKAENGAMFRDVHAFLGSFTMLVLFFHLFTGIQLGLSF
jgi:hypothetical protein